jgi:hypothetical protein
VNGKHQELDPLPMDMAYESIMHLNYLSPQAGRSLGYAIELREENIKDHQSWPE